MEWWNTYTTRYSINVCFFVNPFCQIKLLDNFSMNARSIKVFQTEQVNIGSGNGLVPLGNKPLPEPVFVIHVDWLFYYLTKTNLHVRKLRWEALTNPFHIFESKLYVCRLTTFRDTIELLITKQDGFSQHSVSMRLIVCWNNVRVLCAEIINP